MGVGTAQINISHQPTGRVFEVFLSSTVKDLENYRREVQDALIRKAQIACFPSEEWTGGYSSVLTLIKQRLGQSDGYVLIVGYWYGSIPDRETRSITHMEFEWARARWQGKDFPPMAVFIPKIDSEADKDLHAAAESLLANVNPRHHHEKCMKEFRDLLLNWRKVQEFTDHQDLRERVLVLSKDWQVPLMLVAQGLVADPQPKRAGARLTDSLLGSIGRADHYSAVRKLLTKAKLAPTVPALAILVSGDETAGQAEFIQWVIEHKEITGSKKSIGQPLVDRYDLKVLCKWVADALGLYNITPASPVELADALPNILQQQSLFFGLNRVNRLPGGVAAFQTDFWAPFYARLVELKQLRQFPHRLVAMVTDFLSGANTSVSALSLDGNSDYTRLLTIPCLSNLTKDDIAEWLENQEMVDDPPGRYLAIASRVLSDDAGNPDSRPVFVFRRLRDESLEL